MERITIPVRGITPLLLHNPAGMGAGGDGLGRKQIPTPEEEAEGGAYRLPGSPQLCLPSPAFRGAVWAAAKGRKLGRSFATAIVKGSVFVTSEWTPIVDHEGSPVTSYVVDARRVKVGTAGVTRCRPKITEWACDVEFDFDPEAIAPGSIVELLGIAGSSVGVGDYRPETFGMFGRFEVAA